MWTQIKRQYITKQSVISFTCLEKIFVNLFEWFVNRNSNMADRRCSVSSKVCAFDRFIPYRRNLDVDSSYAKLMASSTSGSPENDFPQFKSPTRKSYTRMLSKSLLSTPTNDGSILPIRCSTPTSGLSNFAFFVCPLCNLNKLPPNTPIRIMSSRYHLLCLVLQKVQSNKTYLSVKLKKRMAVRPHLTFCFCFDDI